MGERDAGSRQAAVATGITAAFVGMSVWWLSQDTAIPYGDAAEHLTTAFAFHDSLRTGDVLAPLRQPSLYPPAVPALGALAVYVGGRSVATPIVAQNLVFVPLLALGCYRTAVLARCSREAAGAAGALAVAFALGAPLLAEQFHVFMLDAPLTALVATCVWLVLASERFRRPGLAAAAGVVAGIGCASKQQFPLYVAGLVAVVLLRGGGWRGLRGLACFAGAAVAVAAPWYLVQADELGAIAQAAGAGATVPPLARPPLLSLGNVSWYGWAVLNGLLFAPLTLFAAIGVVAAALGRTRLTRAPELLGGLGTAWLAITLVPHHDMRYAMPLLVYLAVLATAWVADLPRGARRVATGALALCVSATTLGATFGLGSDGRARELLPGNRAAPRGEGVPARGTVVVYADHDFLVSGPRRVGDLLGLLVALREAGVRNVVWFVAQAPNASPDYNHNGLIALARIAQLDVPDSGTVDLRRRGPRSAVLIRQARLEGTAPCIRLGDGSGVWVRLGNPSRARPRTVCPLHGAGLTTQQPKDR
jgi:hypothetical protein